MTELLVGTKKGLFVLEGEPGGAFAVAGPRVRGRAGGVRDARPALGPGARSVTSGWYGPRIWHADDPAGEWEQAAGVALPEGGDAALERIWVIVAGEADGTLYAGGDPGVLFESRDGGATWELQRTLWEHPTRPDWQPGGGGLCLHSIVPWPGDPDRLALAISAVGVWLTDDRGRTWRHGNDGIVAGYLPDESQGDSINLCVHNLHRAAAAAGTAVHAVPRRRVPLRRRGRDVEQHRRGPAVGLRLPDGARSRRPRQRLRHPAAGRHRPRHARRPGPRVRDARRRGDLDAAGRRPPGRARLPHGAAPGVRRRGGGRRPAAVLRRDVRRRSSARATPA